MLNVYELHIKDHPQASFSPSGPVYLPRRRLSVFGITNRKLCLSLLPFQNFTFFFFFCPRGVPLLCLPAAPCSPHSPEKSILTINEDYRSARVPTTARLVSLFFLALASFFYPFFFPVLTKQHPGPPNPQLWLDGYQGRGLALDKILDGYKSVCDWPVASFYKARLRFSGLCARVGFECGAIPSPRERGGGGLLLVCFVLTSQVAAEMMLEVPALTLAIWTPVVAGLAPL